MGLYCCVCHRHFDGIEDGWWWEWNRKRRGPPRFKCPDHTYQYQQLTLF